MENGQHYSVVCIRKCENVENENAEKSMHRLTTVYISNDCEKKPSILDVLSETNAHDNT